MAAKAIKTVLALLLVLAVFAIVIALLTPATTPASVPPNPNGFDDFVAATEKVVGSPASYNVMNPDQLRGLLNTNSEALTLLRLGLGRECQVPLQYIADRSASPTGIAQWSSMKNLYSLLQAEAKLAENEGRTNDAVTSYLDLLRLGEQLSRGGVVIDKLVAIGAQRRALDGLNRLRSTLSDAECRRALVTLEALAARRERFSEVWKRDQMVMQQTDRRWFGIRGLLTRTLLSRQIRDLRRKMETSFEPAEAEFNLMILELALRRCFLYSGSYPQQLNDLAEKYLKAIPQDPFSNKGFVYRLEDTGYLLYSVGPNGKDDGGTPLSESKDKNVLDGDLVRRANLNPGTEH